MNDQLPLDGRSIIARRCPLYGSMMRLRDDALDRGALELAKVYGYSAIRLGNETLEQIRRTG